MTRDFFAELSRFLFSTLFNLVDDDNFACPCQSLCIWLALRPLSTMRAAVRISLLALSRWRRSLDSLLSCAAHLDHATCNTRRSEAHEGLQRAQLEQKKAKRKDYYKILGLEKTADAATIKRTFRKFALQFHPCVASSHPARHSKLICAC